MRRWFRLLPAAILLTHASLVSLAYADKAHVFEALARHEGNDSWRFDVSVRHKDEGWSHYADKWQILTTDGIVLGERILHHPHVNEQPFTRSLTGVAIPPDVEEVIIRAHDLVHGWGGVEVTLKLER